MLISSEGKSERAIERDREKEKKTDQCLAHKLKKRKTWDIWEWNKTDGKRQVTEGREDGRGRTKSKGRFSLCSLNSAVVLVGRNVQSCFCHQTNVMYDLDLQRTKSRKNSSCQGQQGVEHTQACTPETIHIHTRRWAQVCICSLAFTMNWDEFSHLPSITEQSRRSATSVIWSLTLQWCTFLIMHAHTHWHKSFLNRACMPMGRPLWVEMYYVSPV